MMNAPTHPTGITRLAPSPTGALHLGNARTFLVNWAMARQQGWRVLMRIEDLDGPRVKQGADQQALDIMAWLGMDWDDPPTWQRTDLSPYLASLEKLAAVGHIYPCRCSRKEIAKAQSAPHGSGHDLRYPGTCRPSVLPVTDYRFDVEESDVAWRLIARDEPIAFDDLFAGPQSINVQQQVGDFVVATKHGLPAYQLAVVVDDAAAGVTDIVRGDDLIDSTPRQLLLYEALGLGPLPRYYHLPLVIGEDGRRLAKRHGDSRIVHYRDRGVPAQRVIGLIAEWCGIGRRCQMAATDFARRLAVDRIPHRPIVFTEADDRWLCGD